MALVNRSNRVRREFLGWDKPGLQSATDRLIRDYKRDSELDLGHVIIVVPGQRARRRLLELLAFAAEDQDLCLTPPVITTEGQLPELLYVPKLPFASTIIQDLAWAKALHAIPETHRFRLVSHPPPDNQHLRWLALGRLLRRLHMELAADRLNSASVHANKAFVGETSERSRWAVLAEVQDHYLELLDGQNLWDVQTARIKAIERNEIQTDCDIILLGTVDLNKTPRAMLDRVADRVAAFVIAPADLAEHFDEFGCLLPEKWSKYEVPLSDEMVSQVAGPIDQADAVAQWLAEIGKRHSNDQVVVGIPDESLVPQLQRQLQQCGVRSRWVEGKRIGESAPFRFLAAASQFAGRRRYEDVAALVRHPDFEDWLRDKTAMSSQSGAISYLAALDHYHNTHLPSRFAVDRWPQPIANFAQLDRLLGEAAADRPLREWGQILSNLLGEVYGGRTLDRADESSEHLHRSLTRILEECNRLSEIPESLDRESMSAADAFHLAIGSIVDESLPPAADPDAVELLGWLELALDDSEALIVTSFNEGSVPKSAGVDAFLPDSLRQNLRVMHNERRYARDAYATTVLCHSRRELRVVFAGRDRNGDPVLPSRLLFACPDDALVRRASGYFGETDEPIAHRQPRLVLDDGPIPEKHQFERPRPIKLRRKLERIPVTHFKSYLACRYRYYLRQVRELVAVNDASREMDGGLFGTLLHRVLARIGCDQDGPRHSSDAQKIVAYLIEKLEVVAIEMFGAASVRPAIRLQLEQARQRLRAFAERQSTLVQEGWRITYAEAEDSRNLAVPFDADGGSVQLIGRIDRIDYHERDGKLRIIDYKTADRAQTPEKTHRNGDGWIDLQLPLYRHLLPSAMMQEISSSGVELAYFNLPREFDETGVRLAEWNEVELADADSTARRVIAGIANEEFWPPVDPAPAFSEDFAAICLENLLAAPSLGEGGEDDRP